MSDALFLVMVFLVLALVAGFLILALRAQKRGVALREFHPAFILLYPAVLVFVGLMKLGQFDGNHAVTGSALLSDVGFLFVDIMSAVAPGIAAPGYGSGTTSRLYSMTARMLSALAVGLGAYTLIVGSLQYVAGNR